MCTLCTPLSIKNILFQYNIKFIYSRLIVPVCSPQIEYEKRLLHLWSEIVDEIFRVTQHRRRAATEVEFIYDESVGDFAVQSVQILHRENAKRVPNLKFIAVQ